MTATPTRSAPEPAAAPTPVPRGGPGDPVPRAENWFAGLDALRAVAAFGVLVTHVGILSGYVPGERGPGAALMARADVGVAVFFVLSGFLLYRPFVAARWDGRPGTGVRRYVRHRVLRIFPAYWFALTVLTVVLDAGSTRDDIGSPVDALLYYGLLQSFSESTALGGLSQAWTLHNEIMFYLLLPVWAAGAAWLTVRLGRHRALVVELGVLAVAATAAIGWRLWLHTVYTGEYTPETFDPRFHWLPSNFHMFVPGMALALGVEWLRRDDRRAGLRAVLRRPAVCWVSWAGAAVSFWVSAQVLGTQIGAMSAAQDLGRELPYAAVGFLVVAPVALAGTTLPSTLRWLGSRVMVTLGLLSYGIYLWHVGLIHLYMEVFDEQLFRTALLPLLAVTSIGSVAAAAVSYVLVERPALRLKSARRKAPGHRPDPGPDPGPT